MPEPVHDIDDVRGIVKTAIFADARALVEAALERARANT